MSVRMLPVGEGHHWKENPVLRSSLHDEIASKLRVMIQEGELAPGARVPEIKLCQHFGISRTPLREALKVLASEGLIELRPNRGSMVARIEVEEIAAAFEVMGALERLVGELVCERIGDEELADLLARHERMIGLHRIGDRSAYFRQNQDIHLRLAELTRNRVLANTYSGLMTKISRARYKANDETSRWIESAAEHDEFMAFLRHGDKERFAEALVRHSRNTGIAVIEGLQQEEASGGPGNL